jgi:hypothetical protein
MISMVLVGWKVNAGQFGGDLQHHHQRNFGAFCILPENNSFN